VPRGIRWSPILAVLFVSLLGWYLVYTEQIVRAFRADTATMTRLYAEVQTGLASTDERGGDRALVRLQELILESGVPLVLTAPGDTIISAVNLPFAADLTTPSGQASVRAYIRRLDQLNPPVGDSAVALIHFGDSRDLQRLRWVPWLQVAGLLLTFFTGLLVLRAQRSAAADRAWTAMARELAHQLGTPLSSLQGWLEVLSLPAPERPGGLDPLEITREMETDLERLERVSRRFELIGRETSLDPVDLIQLIEGLERYFGARIPRIGRGVQIEVELEEGLPPVLGNEVLLAWALENVMKNALDAMAGQGGTLSVRAFQDGPEWVTLQVRDTGTGVPAEIRTHLFEPGTTTKSGGWGVGLSLARRIVERIHGGRIELADTGPSGSTIQLTLPLAPSMGATAEERTT